MALALACWPLDLLLVIKFHFKKSAGHLLTLMVFFVLPFGARSTLLEPNVTLARPAADIQKQAGVNVNR